MSHIYSDLSGYGSIYDSTYWGVGSTNNSIGWGDAYKDLIEDFNKYAFSFDGLSPAESLFGASTSREQFETNFNVSAFSGGGFMAWIKIDPNIASMSNFSQRCIVDLSSSIGNTANGKGYSLFIRKTTSQLRLCWFFKRPGETQTNCRSEVNLLEFDLAKPIMVVCGMEGIPSGSGAQTQAFQIIRAYQEGLSGANDYREEIDVRSQTLPYNPSYPTQDLCFGNTNASGTVNSEFRGQIDEISFWKGDFVGWQTASANYFDAGISGGNINLNTNENIRIGTGMTYNPVINDIGTNRLAYWFRFGDNNATFNTSASRWSVNNASGASGPLGSNLQSNDMTFANRVAQIIN